MGAEMLLDVRLGVAIFSRQRISKPLLRSSMSDELSGFLLSGRNCEKSFSVLA